MWAASLFVFLANPLLGTVLLLSAAITTGIKVAKVDAEFARKGEMPPTARLVDKWLDSRKAAGKAPASATVKPYGSWAYAKQRWQAMWEDLGDKHREQRAAHKAAVAEAKKNGTPPPKTPSLKDKLAGWKWSIDALVRPVGEKPAEPGQPDAADTTQIGSSTTPGEVPVLPLRWDCHTCGIGCGGYTTENDVDSDARMHIDKVHGGRGQLVDQQIRIPDHADENLRPVPAKKPTGEGQQMPAQLDDSPPGEQTKPAEPATTSSTAGPVGPAASPEGETMTATTLSGEVTGTRSAIAYARAVADAHTQHSGNEGYLTSLATMEVGDGDIGLVRAAMQKSQEAAAAWAAAAQSIEDHNATIREAYANSPDAANKMANINE